jgi:protein required for attachment to host cells
MQVPHNAFILVADGRKMLFLRNEGDAEYPNLQVEKKLVDRHNPATQDQVTDMADPASSTRTPGANWGSGGGEPTDVHQIEEDRFAAETAGLLKDWALRNEYESLIVVAPPRTLGELRKHYHSAVSDRLKGEIDKDLTGHSVPQIEEALAKAE